MNMELANVQDALTAIRQREDTIADREHVITKLHEEMNDLKAMVIKLQGERQALAQALRVVVSKGEIDPFHELA